MMKILLVTDTFGETNGVVTTLTNTVNTLRDHFNYEVNVIEPSQFKTMACPTYPEVRLSLNFWKIFKMIKHSNPNAIHIATEGPLGLAAFVYCKLFKLPFSTSYHTKWPEYIHARFKLPKIIVYKWLKFIHNSAQSVLVTTQSMKEELEGHGFKNIVVWSRGVDTTNYSPTFREDLGFERPVFINVGRVSVEKNIEEFLKLDIPGTKVIVGDGPLLETFKQKYPKVKFIGKKTGSELAKYYASSDIFVFPSKTDTFGVVLIEAMASRLPIAAYPVTGPKDIVNHGFDGFLEDDLKTACIKCLTLNRDNSIVSSKKYNWIDCTKTFVQSLKFFKR